MNVFQLGAKIMHDIGDLMEVAQSLNPTDPALLEVATDLKNLAVQAASASEPDIAAGLLAMCQAMARKADQTEAG